MDHFMKLIAFRNQDASIDSAAQMGVLVGDSITALTSLVDFYSDTKGWLAKSGTLKGNSIPLTSVQLAVPVPATAKVICVAINYVAHGKEGGLPTPSFPNLFARWSCNLVTNGTPVPVPRTEPDGVDWEVELAAIVGSKMLEVNQEEAIQGLLGYTVFNDISGRASQLQTMTVSTGQWAIGKNIDSSGAVGSIIATADTFDLSNKRLTTKVDGVLMQDGTTADMVFSVPQIIEFIAQSITLNPGDLIATGTPSDVGFGSNPRVYAKPGSVLEVYVEDIGTIANPIVSRA